MKALRWIALFAAFGTAWAAAVPVEVSVDATRTTTPVSPILHGIFFEDINYAADGGLYAELVQNRSFEHADEFVAWGLVSRGAIGAVEIRSQQPLHENNPQYVHLKVTDAGKGFGLANHGYAGIPIRSGDNYLLSFYARSANSLPLRVELEDESGRVLATFDTTASAGGWHKYEGVLSAQRHSKYARLSLVALGAGELDIDMVSLFPERTFNNRRNGMRADIAESIAALKPAFMRFPGGCIVEGRDLANRYQWKHTIGDVFERKQNWNRWQDAIRERPAPNYHQTYGLGFFEYFQFAEDIGAKPVPILNVGMACQYQSKELVPLDELDPYIQDALDLIEFANGSATSPWGSKRAAMGHAAPFNLEYLGIGNEQWGEEYFVRYAQFERVIRKRYPKIKLVSGAGPGVDDKSWQSAWKQFNGGIHAAVVDEHYYRPPQWFLENSTRYDKPFRQCPNSDAASCPRVFAGEYAAHDTQDRKPSLRAAIAEASFMTGLQRNSDLVTMSSYAPLLARADAFQWAPDLIWFDNTRVLRTPSYYTQQLFGTNLPEFAVPMKITGSPVELTRLPPSSVATHGAEPLTPFNPEEIPPLYAFAGIDRTKSEVIIFAANPFDEARTLTLKVEGIRADSTASALRLTGPAAEAINTFERPDEVSPTSNSVQFAGRSLETTLPAQSLTVFRAPLSR